MSHIHLDRLALGSAGSPPFFPPLSHSITHELVGLFGRNGCGKSSLLAAIAGHRSVLSGAITLDGAVGFMRQGAFGAGVTIAGALGVEDALARLDRIEAGAASGGDLDRADWTLPSRLERGLAQFGLSDRALNEPAARLSGGEQARVKLAALALAEPDILLLDEPTNDLDDEGRAMVADFLSHWDGPALVASHDRALLENMDRILELSPTGCLSVTGGWSAFDAQRKAERAQALDALQQARAAVKRAGAAQHARAERQMRRSKQGKAASARRGDTKLEINAKTSQAQRTQARVVALSEEQVGRAQEALSAAQERVERVVPVRIDLPPSRLQPGHSLIEAEDMSLRFGERRVFGPLSLTITGPQRVAVTGRNGVGKSSLLRILSGKAEPSSGRVRRSADRIAVLDQHLALLDDDESALEAMRRHSPSLTAHQSHAALARFGFRGDWSERAVSAMSGGERVRLALACLFSSDEAPAMLILDEPTNHLDIEAIELLEQALRDYDGAILCVSHDRAFRESLRLTKTIALT